MRQALMAAVLLASLQAQTQSFDKFTLSSPPGYSLTRKVEMLAYAKIDEQRRFYCQILVYASQASTGSAEGDFHKEWKEGMAVNVQAKGKFVTRPHPLPNAPDSFSGTVETRDGNDNRAISTLFLVRFPGRYVGVGFNAPSEEAVQACQQDALHVATSIRMLASPGGAAPPVKLVNNAAAISPVGYWERVVATRTSTRYNPVTQTYTYDHTASMNYFRDVHRFRFDANGSYAYELKGFDHNRSERYHVVEKGGYSIAGGAIHFQPKEVKEGRAPSGEEPSSLSPRATPAAHSRQFFIGEHPSTRDSAGLQLRAGEGWESYQPVR